MNSVRLAAYTTLTMLAFASNSLLCRMALKETGIDAASFTSVRILSGAFVLWLLMRFRQQAPLKHGTWRSALALFIYAVTLSFAYRSINTGTGALILFGAVQITMILAGLIAGERMSVMQSTGLAVAMLGLGILVSPGVETPSMLDLILMLASGIAWGIYSLFGRKLPVPVAATAGNFIRAALLTIFMSIITLPWVQLDRWGIVFAILSGALASGLGYVLWYWVLQHMRTLTASTIQLSAPLLAALGGIVLLGESLTRSFLIASLLILGGIWLVLRYGKR